MTGCISKSKENDRTWTLECLLFFSEFLVKNVGKLLVGDITGGTFDHHQNDGLKVVPLLWFSISLPRN